MKTYEYKTIEARNHVPINEAISVTEKKLDNSARGFHVVDKSILNDLGRDGWRLAFIRVVATTSIDKEKHEFIFEKEINR